MKARSTPRSLGGLLQRLCIAAAVILAFMSNAALAGDLKILHINDHHSHLKPDGRMSLKLAGKSTRVRSGGMPAVVARMKQIVATPNAEVSLVWK